MDFAPENFRFLVLLVLVRTRTIKFWACFEMIWVRVTPVPWVAPSLWPQQPRRAPDVPSRSSRLGASGPFSGGDIPTHWGQAGPGCPPGPPSVQPWRELVTSGVLWCANCLNDVSFPQNAAHNHSNYTWQSLIIAFPFNQFLLKYSFCARFQLIFPLDVSQGLGNIPVGRSIGTQGRMTCHISGGIQVLISCYS